MDIDGLTEVLHRHRRALDMPSGIAAPPRRIPLHHVMRLVEHPQREIVRAVLVRRMLQALRRALLVEALAREPSHSAGAAPFLDIEVNPRRCHVGVAVRENTLDQSDHVGHMIGRTGEHRRRGQLDIELGAIALELFDIKIRDFERRLALGARGLLDFVLARVLVRGHVADVSDIHHMAHAIAVEFERAPQRIDEDVRTHIAQMLRQIDRRPARIKGDLGPIRPVERFELLDAAAECIEDLKGLHGRDALKPIARPRPLTSHRWNSRWGQDRPSRIGSMSIGAENA